MAEERMNLPWEILDACNGFSLDIGGSAMKFLYIDKKDWKDAPAREKGSMGVVRVKSFPHEEFQNTEAIVFIADNVHLKRKEAKDIPLILGTGMGVSITQSQLSAQFGIYLQCEEESTCFCEALAYIVKHLPRQEVFYKFDPKDQQDILGQAKSVYKDSLQARALLGLGALNESIPLEDLWFVKKDHEADLEKPMATEENMFPCILVMCGSAFGSMLVYEDGSYDIVNETSLGGKYWLGMASLLNNAQNYEELMTLVAKGDPGPVDMAQHDFLVMNKDKEGMDDGNAYQEFLDNYKHTYTRTIYSYGKVTPENKDEMKPEDLTRAFLDGLIYDTVQLGMTAARIARVRHVYYTGGFVSHPFIQKLMYTQWLKTWAEMSALVQKTQPMEAHFLKHSSQMGALGALLRNLKIKPTKKH